MLQLQGADGGATPGRHKPLGDAADGSGRPDYATHGEEAAQEARGTSQAAYSLQ